jgi:hypothetical protein
MYNATYQFAQSMTAVDCSNTASLNGLDSSTLNFRKAIAPFFGEQREREQEREKERKIE